MGSEMCIRDRAKAAGVVAPPSARKEVAPTITAK